MNGVKTDSSRLWLSDQHALSARKAWSAVVGACQCRHLDIVTAVGSQPIRRRDVVIATDVMHRCVAPPPMMSAQNLFSTSKRY
jgi:hypothetical protein